MGTLIGDDAKLGRMLRLHMRGLSQRDVAEGCEVSQRAVCAALRKLRIPPNGYGTKASRRKRSAAVRQVARLRKATEPDPIVWEAEWPLEAGEIAPRLGYLLFAALAHRGIVSHGEPELQLLPMGDRLIVRAPTDRLPELVAGMGALDTFRVAGVPCRLGVPVLRQASLSTSLHSWCVTVKGKLEQEKLSAWCRRELASQAIGCRVVVGDRRTIKIKGKVIVGYAVRLTRLHRHEAAKVLASGLGGRRRFGCGVFVPC